MKRKPTILIVEDAALTRQLAENFLQQYGSVIVTANPREAVANYMVQKPDIVFLDISYPNHDLDGFDILQNILATNKDAFIVMCSSSDDKVTIDKAIGLGAKGFISKPFSASNFRAYIEKWEAQ